MKNYLGLNYYYVDDNGLSFIILLILFLGDIYEDNTSNFDLKIILYITNLLTNFFLIIFYATKLLYQPLDFNLSKTNLNIFHLCRYFFECLCFSQSSVNFYKKSL